MHARTFYESITDAAKTGEVFSRYGNGADGLRTHYGYDDRSQVASEQTKVGTTSTVVTGRGDTQTYDPIGNRATVVHNGNTATYTLNSLNQYTQRTVPGVFDVAGAAATSATVTVNGSSTGVTRHGEYFFKGQGLSNTPNAASSSLSVSDGTTTSLLAAFLPGTPEPFGYDLAGNLLSDGRWDYTYDAENRIKSIQTHAALCPGTIANADARRLEFKYDYLGRRVEKLVRAGYNGTGYATVASDIRFMYDGWNVLFEYDAANGLAWVRWNIWGLDLSGTLQGAGGAGGLLYAYDCASATGFFPACDAMGNVLAMINRNTGSIAAAYEYDAFGNLLRLSGTYGATNPVRFSSKYTDDETGLVYYGRRFYSPSQGRFLGRDPTEEKGGLHLYACCRNNLVNAYDYLGMNEDDGYLSIDHPIFGPSSDGYHIPGVIGYETQTVFQVSTFVVNASRQDAALDASTARTAASNWAAAYADNFGDPSFFLDGRSNDLLREQLYQTQADIAASLAAASQAPIVIPKAAVPNSADVASTSLFIGQQIGDAGTIRQGYINTVAGLDPTDSAGRTAAKIAARADTPPLVGSVIQGVRPGTGPNPGSVGSANVTNPGVNSLGQTLRIGGAILVGAGLTYDAIDIFTSPNPARTATGSLGGWVGAYYGGLGGTLAGTAARPGVGTIIGGVGGAALGSYLGRQGALGAYDRAHPPPPRPPSTGDRGPGG